MFSFFLFFLDIVPVSSGPAKDPRACKDVIQDISCNVAARPKGLFSGSITSRSFGMHGEDHEYTMPVINAIKFTKKK